MNQPITVTSSGQIQGTAQHGIESYFGVPYAAAPTGPLRYAAPSEHEPWTGIRDAIRPGPTAPQFTRAFPVIDIVPLIGTGWSKGDDYLTANVWTPACNAKGLPVMVFIHGGAFAVGSNNATVSDGAAFARSGVVCFSINYRLGIDGFLAIPGAPTNLGLRDMLFALRWVKQNAAAFGGDPDNVTVFGESAGAMAIGLLLSSPLAEGLFQHAILQSGHASALRTQDVGLRVTQRAAEMLNISCDAEGFKGRTGEDTVAALEAITQPTTVIDLRNANGYDPIFGLSKLTPVLGDDVLPIAPLQAIQQGASKNVEVLIGTNREEMNLYFVPTGVRNALTAPMATAILQACHTNAVEILDEYGLSRPGNSAGAVFTSAMHDLVFRAPSRMLAAARHGKTHFYEFGWRSPACNGELGACHGLELPFVFRTLPTCIGPNGIVGEIPPQELSDSIHKLWADFAAGKGLPWPEFTSTSRSVYALEKQACALEPPIPAEKYLRTDLHP